MNAVEAEASAPGKLILMGEHAAVYGVPAVVASVGLRTVATVGPPAAGSELALALTDFSLRESCSWREIVEFGDRRRELWEAYEAAPSPERFSALRAGDEAGVVKIAVAETLSFLEQRSRVSGRPSLSLSVRSELPVGSGFGSSAAVAVAVAAALFAGLTGDPGTTAELAGIALEVEKRQHGRPSGIDHMTVLRGGLLLLAGGRGDLDVEELREEAWFVNRVRVFDTGTPAESTGQVVAEVRAERERNPDRFAAHLERMATAVRAFADALASPRAAWRRVTSTVRDYQRCLEDLGVVPESVRREVRRIEAAGAAAKISGAGALSGSRAGSVIVFWPPAADGDPESILGDYRPLSAVLGGGGLECRIGGGSIDARA